MVSFTPLDTCLVWVIHHCDLRLDLSLLLLTPGSTHTFSGLIFPKPPPLVTVIVQISAENCFLCLFTVSALPHLTSVMFLNNFLQNPTSVSPSLFWSPRSQNLTFNPSYWPYCTQTFFSSGQTHGQQHLWTETILLLATEHIECSQMCMSTWGIFHKEHYCYLLPALGVPSQLNTLHCLLVGEYHPSVLFE